MELFEILIFVICLVGAVALIPTGITIMEHTRYYLGGVIIVIYGCICGIATIAGLSQVWYILTN
mgnify:FL=1